LKKAIKVYIFSYHNVNYQKQAFGIDSKGFFIKNEIDFLLTIGPVIENQKLSKPSHAIPVTEKFME
jgi:hypothetical protein